MQGRWRLVTLLCVALAVRIAAVVLLASDHGERLTYEHGEIAENLLAGRGFTVRFLGQEGPTAQQGPLYPLALAGLYGVLGAGSERALCAMQLVQCFAGTLIVACVYYLTRFLLPERPSVAWWSAAVAALYPTHVYMVTHIQVVTWAALTLAVFWLVLSAPSASWGKARSAVAGAVGGILLLLEPIFLVCMPIAAWVVWRRAARETPPSHRPTPPRAMVSVALFLCAAVAVTSPWMWRNYRAFGEIVFVKSTFGYALWQGNHPLSHGTDKIPKASADAIRRRHDGTLGDMNRALWEARHETVYIDDVALAPGDYERFAGLSEPARSRVLGGDAWGYITGDPARYVRLCAARLYYFLLFDTTNPKAAHPVYRVATAVWLVLVIGGLAAAGRSRRRLAPVLATCAAVALFHAATITSVRFRIPLEPLSFLLVGICLDSLTAGRGGRKTVRRAVSAAPHVSPRQTAGLRRRNMTGGQ